jgi:hypothetical protein
LFQFLFIPSSIWTQCLRSVDMENPLLFIIQFYSQY